MPTQPYHHEWNSEQDTSVVAHDVGMRSSLESMIAADYAGHHASKLDTRAMRPNSSQPKRRPVQSNPEDAYFSHPQLVGMTKGALSAEPDPPYLHNASSKSNGSALSGWTNSTTASRSYLATAMQQQGLIAQYGSGLSKAPPVRTSVSGSLWTDDRSYQQEGSLARWSESNPRESKPSHSEERAMFRVASFHSYRVLRKVFRAWFTYVQAHLEAVEMRSDLMLMRRSWNVWAVENWQAKAAARAELDYEKESKRAVMSSWLHEVTREKITRAKLERHETKRQQRMLAGIMTGWRMATLESKIDFMSSAIEDLHIEMADMREQASYASNVLLAQQDSQPADLGENGAGGGAPENSGNIGVTGILVSAGAGAAGAGVTDLLDAALNLADAVIDTVMVEVGREDGGEEGNVGEEGDGGGEVDDGEGGNGADDGEVGEGEASTGAEAGEGEAAGDGDVEGEAGTGGGGGEGEAGAGGETSPVEATTSDEAGKGAAAGDEGGEGEAGTGAEGAEGETNPGGGADVGGGARGGASTTGDVEEEGESTANSGAVEGEVTPSTDTQGDGVEEGGGVEEVDGVEGGG
eukprot:gene21871-28903_t